MTRNAPDEHFPLALARDRADALAALRRRLAGLGFAEASVRRALGVWDITHMHPGKTRTWDRLVLRHGEPLHSLIRMFLFGYPEHEECVAAAFDEGERALLGELGLLERRADGHYRARVALFPFDDLLVATDFSYAAGESEAPNRVMYLGGDSYGLARLAGRPGGARGRDALDLCTGSGVAALHAARFYDRVVGVDINPRAINFARFNALLNGLGNVAFEVGDLYAGLGAFDLITANPPFVPTARPGGLIYRDGGAGGQEILARVVAGLSEHLRPGGACAIVLDLVEHRGRPYDEKLRAWLGRAEGFNCAIMKGPAIGAYDYAIAHHAAERWGGDAEDAELDATLAQYSAEGIESVSPAYICIGRRAESSGETRIETVPISRLLGPDEILPDLLFEIVGRVEALRAIDLETAPLVSTCRVHGVVLASESPFYRRFPVSPEMNAALELLLPLGSAREVVAALRRTSPDFGEADAAELFRTLAWMFVVGLVKRP